MKLNNVTTSAIAVALAVTLGSGVAAAQATTRTKVTKDKTTTTTTRTPMKVSKENTSTGEVQPAPAPTPAVNQDSINQARYRDSLAAAERMRQDSIARAEQMRRDSIANAERMRADSIARADSISRANALALRLRQIGGAYFGMDAGVTAPTQNVDVAHSAGWNAEGMFGVDPIGSPLGFRVQGGYTQLGSRNVHFGYEAPHPQIINLGADLKLRLPSVERYMSRFSIYGVGGVSNFWYKDLELVAQGGGAMVPRNGDSWTSKLGWNAGGGLNFGWGKTNLFAEARYETFTTGGLKGGHVPIVLGLTWF